MNKRNQLFAKYVDVINIETSSYCNRTCDFCPLSLYPRTQNFMRDTVFDKILTELKEIGYENRIALNLYNEPLLDKYILDRIKNIKDKLPNVYIQMNSNGDFLTLDFLHSLINAGLNQILITLHPLPSQKYDDDDRENHLKQYLKKLGIKVSFQDMKKVRGKNITVETYVDGLRFYLVCNNWRKYGNNRGGSLQQLNAQKLRDFPCNNAFREICIDYEGKYRPCCNVYFNVEDYGNIECESLVDFYFSDKMTNFKRKCFNFTNEPNACCAYCNTEDNATRNEKELRETLLSEANLKEYMV